MAALSKLEMLPVEIMHSILSYLVHPRSRLPGLTEYQSTRECPEAEKKAAKDAYQLNPTVSPDVDRYAVDLFSIGELHHPINDLASTSKHLRDRTEQYCAHLVKKCSTLNLYFSQADSNDLQAVNPDLSAGIYRRLWLRHGPRYCTYCNALLDSKNERATRTFIEASEDCFYAQVYVSIVGQSLPWHRVDAYSADTRRSRKAFPYIPSRSRCLPNTLDIYMGLKGRYRRACNRTLRDEGIP